MEHQDSRAGRVREACRLGGRGSRTGGHCLLPRGCQLLLWGKPNAKNKRARSPPGLRSVTAGVTWPLTPAFSSSAPDGFRSPLAATGGTAQELCRQHRKVLLRPSCLQHCQPCRVYVGPTAHGDSSVPPTLAAHSYSRGFPELHFRCSWAPGKGTKEPFSSPASPGVEGEGERKDQCLQNTTIGRKFSSGFSRLGVFSLSSSF